MRKHISSLQNELIKRTFLLQSKSRVRKKEGLFVVEGVREITLALDSGFQFQFFMVCEDIAQDSDIKELERLSHAQSDGAGSSTEWISVSKKVYEHLAHRKTTEGFIGISVVPNRSLQDLSLGKNPLILVAEASEKPGNIGALLRTADAANLDAVIIANPKTDLFNPNIIRSSVGCVFTQNVIAAPNEEIISYLKQRGISIRAAALNDTSIPYHKVDFKKATAIVLGTEDTGLSHSWLDKADELIQIPMEGKIDSLNVSVSGAILIFEAKRQRSWSE
jgi:TrmH family RNA methyltransferase